MHYLTMWNWLVANNLLKDIIAWLVGVVMASVFSTRFWKTHMKNQKKISDLLDTSTPGGLADVVNAISSNKIEHKGK